MHLQFARLYQLERPEKGCSIFLQPFRGRLAALQPKPNSGEMWEARPLQQRLLQQNDPHKLIG